MTDEKSNTGDRNTGSLNTGDRNTGYRNTGDRNTGSRNTGNLNTGNLNAGNLNTGSLNAGNRNTGYLNDADGVVTFFGVVVPGLSWDDAGEMIPYIEMPQFSCEWIETSMMTDAEKESAPSHKTTGGFIRKYDLTIQQSFPVAWAKITRQEKMRWLTLPNFNPVKFLNCTGVDVRLDKDLYPESVPPVPNADLTGDTIVLNGKTYRLVPV